MTPRRRVNGVTHLDIAACARQLHRAAAQATSPEVVLQIAADQALALIDHVDHVGATLITGRRHRRHRSAATTGPVPTVFAELEASHGMGPFVESVRFARTTIVRDFVTDLRWPALRHALPTTTPASCLVVPFVADDGTAIGALSMFADTVDIVDDVDVGVAEAFATHAALAVTEAERGQQFSTALASRDVLGQAKGIIMERFGIDAVEAFDLLRRLSQDTNIRAVDIAERLVRTGVADCVSHSGVDAESALTG